MRKVHPIGIIGILTNPDPDLISACFLFQLSLIFEVSRIIIGKHLLIIIFLLFLQI